MRLAIARLGTVLLLAACNPVPQHPFRATPTPVPNATPGNGLPPIVIRGSGTATRPIRIVEKQDNRRVYELLAASYVSHSSQTVSEATFSRTSVTFFDKNGSRLQAQAPVARVDQARKQVILTGGVHARNDRGLTLVCDRLTYDRGTGHVHGEGHVQVLDARGSPPSVVTGNTFDSDVNLTRMQIR